MTVKVGEVVVIASERVLEFGLENAPFFETEATKV